MSTKSETRIVDTDFKKIKLTFDLIQLRKNKRNYLAIVILWCFGFMVINFITEISSKPMLFR